MNENEIIIERLEQLNFNLSQLIKLLTPVISKEGLIVSGNGIIVNNLKSILEKLDTKIDKKLFFIEKRQREWRQEFEKMNGLPIEQDRSGGQGGY